jgi:putative ABC transport system permease protein
MATRLEHWLLTLPLKLRGLFRRSAVEQDLDDEIRDHLEEQVAGYVAQGMSRDEAWQLARRSFGGIEQAKERCRDARGLNALDSLAQDVRYAARTMRRQPGFAAVAAITLALGIGANTAVFSLVDGVLFEPLPYAAPERLVSVRATYPNGAFAAMRDEVRSLDVAAYAEGKDFILKDGADPARLIGTRVSAELLAMLGVRPALGRWLRPGEDVVPNDRLVVLSHELWMTRYKGDASIVGRFVEVEGVRREIIAVMPPSFQFPSARTQIWVPLAIDPRNTPTYWAGDFMPVVGRLASGATPAQALHDARLGQSRIRPRFPWRMPDDWNQNVSVVPLAEAIDDRVRSRLFILSLAVVLVLVIACANVANLSLSRAVVRQREIAIRTAIGASPRRIARQLLTESLVLAALGGVLGILVAWQALAILKAVLPSDTPRLMEAEVNLRALVFTGAVSVLTGCAFGLVPALSALRLRLRAVLDSGGRSGGATVAGPVRSALTVAQIACAVLLVIAAGLLVRSLWSLSRSNPGFRAAGVVTATISPSESVCSAAERCLAFYRELDDRLRSAPGIDSAALVNTLPLTGAIAKRSVDIQGYTVPAGQSDPLLWLHVITPQYFSVMDIPLVAGRQFEPADGTGSPAAIITAETARKFWPDRSPIGDRLRFVGETHWRTIVGIAADVRAYDLTKSVPDYIAGTIYVPYSPYATMENGRLPSDMTIVARTRLADGQAQGLMRRLVAGMSGDVVIGDARSMQEVMTRATAAPAATASLLVSMASLALVLGCIGVYGVLSFLVSRRTRDLGIRFALGAQPSDIFWLVLKEGATLCVAGVVIGMLGAAVGTRWLASELHGVGPMDPATYGAVAAIILVVTLLACYVPTRRAMRVDPLIVLRDH